MENKVINTLIIIFSVLWVFTYYWYVLRKKEKPCVKHFEMTEPVQLRFIKSHDFNEYKMQFFNPYCEEWWAFPEVYCGIHALWSFDKKGSYGAYKLGKMKVGYKSIEFYKRNFITLEVVQQHFDRLNKKYYEFKNSKDRHNSLPDVII